MPRPASAGTDRVRSGRRGRFPALRWCSSGLPRIASGVAVGRRAAPAVIGGWPPLLDVRMGLTEAEVSAAAQALAGADQAAIGLQVTQGTLRLAQPLAEA